MNIQETILLWLAEYCCLKKYTDEFQAIVAIAQNGSHNISHKISSVRLATLLLHDVVKKKFDVSRFHTVIHTANELFNILPHHAVTFKLYAKVTTGLKILVLFDLLKTGNKFVLPRLNEFFPRTGIDHPKADKALAAKLSTAQLKFRRFLLSMIASKTQQEAYFKEEYDREYGQDFRDKVKDLMLQYIAAIEQQLPATHIERLSTACHSDLGIDVQKLKSPVVNLLLDMCEKKHLTKTEVTDIAQALVTEKEENHELIGKRESNIKKCDPVQSSELCDSPKSISQNMMKSTTVDVYHCSFDSLQPSKEMYISTVAKDPSVSGDSDKTRVPLGKVYRMNCRQKHANSRSSMKDQVESVYRTIQTESNDKPDSCRVETTSSNIRKNSKKRFRSPSPEEGISTSQDVKEGKKQCQEIKVSLKQTAQRKLIAETQATKSVACSFNKPLVHCDETSDPSQETFQPSPEQVYTISSSSGYEESQGISQETHPDNMQDTHTQSQSDKMSNSHHSSGDGNDQRILKNSETSQEHDLERHQNSEQQQLMMHTIGSYSTEKQQHTGDHQSLETACVNDHVCKTIGIVKTKRVSQHNRSIEAISNEVINSLEDDIVSEVIKGTRCVVVSSETDPCVPDLHDKTGNEAGMRLGDISELTVPSKKRKLSIKKCDNNSITDDSNEAIVNIDRKRIKLARNLDQGKPDINKSTYACENLSQIFKMNTDNFTKNDKSYSVASQIQSKNLKGETSPQSPSESGLQRTVNQLEAPSERMVASGRNCKGISSFQDHLSKSSNSVKSKQTAFCEKPEVMEEVVSSDAEDRDVSKTSHLITSPDIARMKIQNFHASPHSVLGQCLNVPGGSPLVNEKSPTLSSQSSDISFYSCVASPQYALNEDDVIATPYKSALELPVLNEEDETNKSTNNTLVEDSDDEVVQACVDSTILPSSNSIDKYDALLEFGQDMLPHFDKYLRPGEAKLCVVKLFQNEGLEWTVGNRRYNIYS